MTELRYERPATIDQAVALVANEPKAAVVLAGGTDLQLKLRNGLDPAVIVDIKAIPELSLVRWGKDRELTIGSAVTMRQIYEDREIAQRFPGLAKGAEAVGSFQVRCRATIGGNLCNASPCMDTAPALLVLGASLRVRNAEGERTIPLIDFFAGVKRTALKPTEIVTAIVIPAAAREMRTAFGKIKRVRGHDLALVNCCVGFDASAGTLKAAIGSSAPTPVLTQAITGVIANKADPDGLGRKLASLALEVVKPIDDVRASAEYRRDMAAVLCRRLVHEVLAGRTQL